MENKLSFSEVVKNKPHYIKIKDSNSNEVILLHVRNYSPKTSNSSLEGKMSWLMFNPKSKLFEYQFNTTNSFYNFSNYTYHPLTAEEYTEAILQYKKLLENPLFK